MHKQKYYVIPLLVLLLVVANYCSKDDPTGPQFKSLKEEVDYIVRDYNKVGGIIGVIDKHGYKQVYSYGSKVKDQNEPPDEYTLFEIGSVTKTFTTTLLADMFLRNEVTTYSVNKFFSDGKFNHGSDKYGYSTFVGFNSSAKTGFVVLLNYAAHGDELIIGPKILSAIMKY